MYRRQAAEENHNGGDVFVGHVAEAFVRHRRKQRSPVCCNAFTNGPGDGVIAPLARPVSGSEVILVATRRNLPSSYRTFPAPSFESSTGGSACSSCLAWQPMQLITACTRQSPRRMRPGVASNLREVSGRFFAPITGRHPTVNVTARTTSTSKTRIP